MIEDHGDIQLETTEGWRPEPSRGERVLVILAAVALLGGALIVGGNLLGKDDEVSLASTSPGPSGTPVPTPSPTPSPMELVVSEAFPTPTPAESASPIFFSGWIRAKADLPILAAAATTANEVGTLRAGEAAYVDEVQDVGDEAGWVSINVSEETSYVATRANGEELVKRYPPTEWPVVGSFSSLAAGPSGFVAIGNRAGRSGSSPMTVFASADGAVWHVASEPPSSGQLTGVAWGPAGWLLAAADDRGEQVRLWSSADADRWSMLGSLPLGSPQGLQASSRGYLLQTLGSFREDQLAWFSTDGIHWTESRPGLGQYHRVTATPAGFYAATTGGTAAFSTDGLTWSPETPNLLVGSVDDGLIGIAAGLDGRGASPQWGAFYRGNLSWRPMQDSEESFAGAVVTSLVSDGERATAFGWDTSTDASLAWTSDGGPWTRQRLPAAFGGPLLLAAAGNGHVIAVGTSWNERGANPVVWHRDGLGFWEPERSPVAGVVPEPSAVECGALPTDAVDFVNLDRTLAVACHGDAPMTIRLWSSRCDGCTGAGQGSFDEGWLSNPTRNALYLSPMDGPEGWWWSYAVLAPTLASAPDPGWLDAWLEVTGHVDDPAARRCHWTPLPDQLQYYGGARSTIEGCRQQFVVTEVRVVDGP